MSASPLTSIPTPDNVWTRLRQRAQPIMILAPMDDVTDLVFRQVVAELAPADLYMTEFASVEGFCSAGRHAIERRLRLAAAEPNVIAQIWGTTPEHYYEMARELYDRGFVGIDINMGCPVRDIVRNGACSGLIKNPTLAAEIIAATKAGAGNLPVSVKTRLGQSRPEIEDWLGWLLGQGLAALTIHLRTVKELSKAEAHWELMPEIVALRDKLAPETALIGNGDVANRQQGIERAEQTGRDGGMLGRGIFHDPWAFAADPREHTVAERRDALLRHLEIFEATWQNGEKGFEPLKRFFKIYINGFAGAADFRIRLMETKDLAAARAVINSLS